jgi:phosphate transport system ATP-binding protein
MNGEPSHPTGGVEVENLNCWYGGFQALHGVSTSFQRDRITALVGPSGCGKTTLLRCLNRVHERSPAVRTTGQIRILNQDIFAPDVCVRELRRQVGMVFQRPNPLPLSVFENVAFGLRIHGRAESLGRAGVAAAVETALRSVDLWDAVRDQLEAPAARLSLEQQQRLCFARLLPLEPSVLLLDEPCSALDAAGTTALETLMQQLAPGRVIVLVTHSLGQARRISDHTAYLLLGELVEQGSTNQLFTQPRDPRTAEYLGGHYG